MFQPEQSSIKQDIAFALAVAAAGFKLTDNRSVDTDDGVCWQATLAFGRLKIVTVSNGGYGGDDESHFHAMTDAAKAVASLEKLFAVPEVAAAVRGHMLSNLNRQKQFTKVEEVDYAAAEAKIAATVPAPTVDNVEFLVGRIADVTGIVNSYKRAIKTKLLVVFEGGDQKGEYVTYKCADTPENRASLKQHEKRKIDFFIADLLNAPTGAAQ